jgi:hypothetical protein
MAGIARNKQRRRRLAFRSPDRALDRERIVRNLFIVAFLLTCSEGAIDDLLAVRGCPLVGLVLQVITNIVHEMARFYNTERVKSGEL